MRKSTIIVKRLLALFLVVLMSIESFGALVSDNDGSAFITKGEFDSLKSSFQSQIDNYNTSIDSKIDGAISAYLAGINMAKKKKMDSLWVKYNAAQPLVFRNQANYYNEMAIGDLNYQWCALLLWSFVNSRSRGTAYNATETNGYDGMNFWSPLDCNDARKYRLSEVGDSDKDLLYGDMITHNGNYWFGVHADTYNHLKGVISVFGANVNVPSHSQSVKLSGVHGTIKWPPFNLDFRSYDSNTSFSYDFDLDISFVDILMPLAVTLNWSVKPTYINPFFDFVNQSVDVSKNIMTVDKENLQTWTVNDEINKPYTESGGEVWIWAARSLQNGSWESIDIRRNYFGRAWGFVPPNYNNKNSTDKKWDVSWESTANNYIKYKRPYISTYNPDRICNYTAYQVLGFPVTSYNGMPIVEIDEKLSALTFKIDNRVYNSGDVVQSNAGYYLLVSKKPFGTASSSSIVASGETDDIKIFNLNTATQGIKITFDKDWVEGLEKGDYLYGRVYSTTNDTYAVANIYDIEGTTES